MPDIRIAQCWTTGIERLRYNCLGARVGLVLLAVAIGFGGMLGWRYWRDDEHSDEYSYELLRVTTCLEQVVYYAMEYRNNPTDARKCLDEIVNALSNVEMYANNIALLCGGTAGEATRPLFRFVSKLTGVYAYTTDDSYVDEIRKVTEGFLDQLSMTDLESIPIERFVAVVHEYGEELLLINLPRYVQ